MKYKVGDVVKVRSDLICGKTYNDLRLVEKMDKYKGKIVHIMKVVKNWYYIIEELEDRHY